MKGCSFGGKINMRSVFHLFTFWVPIELSALNRNKFCLSLGYLSFCFLWTLLETLKSNFAPIKSWLCALSASISLLLPYSMSDRWTMTRPQSHTTLAVLSKMAGPFGAEIAFCLSLLRTLLYPVLPFYFKVLGGKNVTYPKSSFILFSSML